MGIVILADTTFLIDLQRSRHNERHKTAMQWLEKHSDVEIALPAVVLGEFAEGFEDVSHPVVDHYLKTHRIIPVDTAVALAYSRISRELRQKGTPIGANDTWIAATALANQLPLLTRNVNHHLRVGGLEVLGYGVS